MTPKQAYNYYTKTCAKIKKLEKIYKTQNEICQATANALTKFKTGDIVSIRDDCNRLKYYFIHDVSWCVNHEQHEIKPRIYVYRCTKSGAPRGLWKIYYHEELQHAQIVNHPGQ